jgi:uncharacterized SAM-binding protein YcdF (DUF218 family)
MLYLLSKVAWFLLQPSSLVLACCLVGWWLDGGRWRRFGRRLLTVGIVGLAVAMLLPVSDWLAAPLEARFPRPRLADVGRIDAIIVLGGGLDGALSRDRATPALTEAGERLTEAVALARRLPAIPLIYTTGPGDEAAARQLFADLGLDPGRLTIERHSRNTADNASGTARLVAGKPGGRYLLVTSAWHMPRSVGAFRKAGLEVVAWPTDYLTSGAPTYLNLRRRPSERLSQVDLVAKEWVGLLAYWLRGWSSELFPAP